jgi:hypothetical protein
MEELLMARTMRAQKRLLAAALSAVLIMPLMSMVLAPSANAVSNLQLSRGIQGEGVGRAEENIQLDVYSKLANGSTTSTDVIYAWIEGAPIGFAGNTEIKLSVSTDVTNSIQHAYFEIPVTIAGNYSIRFCATVSSVQPTTNYGSSAGAPDGGNWTHIRSCEAKNIKVGETPALITNCVDIPHEPNESEIRDYLDTSIPYNWVSENIRK